MARTLIVVPAMYSREELEKTLGLVPDDFEEAYSEFWSYVEEKLKPFRDRIYTIYSEKPSLMEEAENRANAILKKLIENHADFHCVEDPLLIAEAEAWLEMMENGQSQAAGELFEENLKERDEHAKRLIDRTLEEGKIGVLFIDPARKIPLPDDVRVIRMCPFDPVDYLNRHLAKLKMKRREGQGKPHR